MYIKKTYKNEAAETIVTPANVADFAGKVFVLKNEAQYEVTITGTGELFNTVPVVLLSNGRHLMYSNFNRSYILKDAAPDKWGYMNAVADAYVALAKKNGIRARKVPNGTSNIRVDFNGPGIVVDWDRNGILLDSDKGVLIKPRIRIPDADLRKYATPEEAAAAIVADYPSYL
jgi:hypothetical protein